MNTAANDFQLTLADKQQFSVFRAVFGAIAAKQDTTISTKALTLNMAGSWSVVEKRISTMDQWTLHIVMQSPTFELLEALADLLKPHVSDLSFHVHRCSDWQAGQVGLMLTLNELAANTLARSGLITQLANSFQIEIALLKNAPQLANSGLLVMDMDSTVIAIECIDQIAALAGVGEAVAEVTEQAMRGELDFAQSLVSRVKCLAGLEESALEVVKHQLPLMPGLMRLIHELNANRWHIAIASGGFTYFSKHLERRLGLDESIANVLSIEDGKLTGEVVGPIIDAKAKAESIDALSERWQVPATQTIAMGDGANDLKMMERAHLGIAFKAKPIVQKQADAAICFSGLDTALFYLR